MRDALEEAAAKVSDALTDWAATVGPHIDVMDDEGMAFLASIKSLRAALAARSEPEPAVGEMLVAYRIATTPGESVPAGWTRIGVWEQSAARSEPLQRTGDAEHNGLLARWPEADLFAALDAEGWFRGLDTAEATRATSKVYARLARSEPGAEGLDVERLQRMTEYWPNDGDHRWCDEDSGGGHRFDSRAWAEDFAREYAALAETEPKP